MARFESETAGAGDRRRKRRRATPWVEAEVEWSYVVRRFRSADARTLAIVREAFLAGYLHHVLKERAGSTGPAPGG